MRTFTAGSEDSEETIVSRQLKQPRSHTETLGFSRFLVVGNLTSIVATGKSPCSVGNMFSNGGFSIVMLVFGAYTPPKFKSSPLKRYQNPIGRANVFQSPFFRGGLLNCGGVTLNNI